MLNETVTIAITPDATLAAKAWIDVLKDWVAYVAVPAIALLPTLVWLRYRHMFNIAQSTHDLHSKAVR